MAIIARDNAPVVYRHNIIAGGRIVAIYTNDSDLNQKIRYLHYDHLGSVNAITDGNGSVVARMSFSAFGTRRDPNDWQGPPSDVPNDRDQTFRGYTGHEQLDALGLIHMNGRVYDPAIARMASADPFVQAPYQSQSLNRYSYVWNNPTTFTDPSGYTAAITMEFMSNWMLGGGGAGGGGAGWYGFETHPCNPDCGTIEAHVWPLPTQTELELELLQDFFHSSDPLLEAALSTPVRRTSDKNNNKTHDQKDGKKDVSDSDQQLVCPSRGAVVVYRAGGTVAKLGGRSISYGAATLVVTAPAYLSPFTAPAGAAGTSAGTVSMLAGAYMSVAGAGLQFGAAVWTGVETGNWRPLAAVGAPAVAGAIAPLSPLIGPTFEDKLQNYIENHGAAIDSCVID